MACMGETLISNWTIHGKIGRVGFRKKDPLGLLSQTASLCLIQPNGKWIPIPIFVKIIDSKQARWIVKKNIFGMTVISIARFL